MLAYLVSFYDIQLFAPRDEVEARPEASDFERAIERLEVILGLNGDNFTKFKERVAELARRPMPSATKRSQPPAREGHEVEGRRPRLELRPHVPAENKSHSSEELDNARL